MPVGDNDDLQMRLAHDPKFIDRVQYWMVKVARDVRAEDPNTVGHAARNTFAAAVLGNPGLIASQVAVGLVTHINITSETTAYNALTGALETSASGAALFSAINNIWNVYAGV